MTRSQRIIAVAFAALLLVPAAGASHTNAYTPDAPGLPHAEPTADCFPVGVDQRVLEAANAVAQQDTGYFAITDQGVPALCLQGQPVAQWQSLVADLDRILDSFRNASAEVQRQYDARLEHTLPGGSREACLRMTVGHEDVAEQDVDPGDAPDHACGLVRPELVLLDDRFDGRRVGGFGEWTVVTANGAPPLLHHETTRDFNGTHTSWRFGDDEGYPRGAHQWLVSPEIDLTTLQTEASTAQQLIEIRNQAHRQIRESCGQSAEQSPLLNTDTCGADNEQATAPFLAAVYERAVDEALQELPVMQAGAAVALTYATNFQEGVDGVRLWVYEGTAAPTRLQLFARSITGDSRRDCGVGNNVDPSNPAYGTVQSTPLCFEDPGSAAPIGQGEETDLDQATEATLAFRSGLYPSRTEALTGDSGDVRTLSFNLTQHIGKRVWLLFEVRTSATSTLRGGSFFDDPDIFPRDEGFGFEMRAIRVTGDGYHRNLRVKDVAADLGPMLLGNDLGDATSVRTTLPPGDDGVLVRLHNAGQYVENATLRVVFEVDNQPMDGIQRWSVHPDGLTTLPIVEMKPFEVREVRVAWPVALAERSLWRVNATILVDTATVRPEVNATRLTDPSAIAARTQNGGPEGAKVFADAVIRAYTLHDLVPTAPAGSPGAVLQVCSDVDATSGACAFHYAAKRGEPRVLYMGVRNAGSVAEDASVTLRVSLDGVDMGGVIEGDAVQTLVDLLPGEERTVQWRIIPTEPGAYLAEAFVAANGAVLAQAERVVYVQRSTGTLCADDLAEARACAPAFSTTRPDALAGAQFTAALVDHDGIAWAATAPDPADAKRGGLHQRGADGEWRLALDLSNASLMKRFAAKPNDTMGWGAILDLVEAPDGTIWMVGTNATVLSRSTTGEVKRHEVPQRPDQPAHLRAAAWHNGTLWIVGDHGAVYHLNATKIERVDLRFPVGEADLAYGGTLHDVREFRGDLYVAGASGFVFVRDRSDRTTVQPANHTAAWRLVDSADNPLTVPAAQQADALARDILTLHEHGGVLLAAGEGSLLMGLRPAGFERLDAPDLLAGAIERLLTTHLGDLYAIDSLDRIAACNACSVGALAWSYPEIPLPTVFADGVARPAGVQATASGDGVTLMLGEDGAVLDFADLSPHDNAGDWTTVPSVMTSDGVIQTMFVRGAEPTSNDAAIRGVLTPAAQADSRGATQFRVTLKHHVARADASESAIVRLFATDAYRSYYFQTTGSTNGGFQTLCDPDSTLVVLSQTCSQFVVGEWTFSEPTPSDGWVTFQAAATPRLGAGSAAVPILQAIELYKEGGVKWAVDAAYIEGLIGGKWVQLLKWETPADSENWRQMYVSEDVNPIVRPYCSTTIPPTVVAVDNIINGQGGLRQPIGCSYSSLDGGTTSNAWEVSFTTFDRETDSPWHISQDLADRPVWVANNEVWGERPGSGAPRILNDWNARLVSPVIDLSAAYDPVISFRHAYAFRTQIVPPSPTAPAGTKGTFGIGDGGWIEVQYERTEAECLELRLVPPCWSPFYKVVPDDHYPNRTRGLGLADKDVASALVRSSGDAYAENVVVGYAPGTTSNAILDDATRSTAYWGRSVQPSETKVIEGVRFVDTDDYQTVTVSLGRNVCADWDLGSCDRLPINVTGRKIRVGFHMVTSTTGARLGPGEYSPEGSIYYHEGDLQAQYPSSFAGEGWYVADLKVLGARQLGLDLRASDLAFRVGYDVERIGVGPATSVPVNVTVSNRGVFDAPGYTGVLEVRKVTDALAKRSVVVERVVLGQQPALEAGRSVNHTFFWSVPAEEGARYFLSFSVKPMGIDVDEDAADNVARLGAVTDPVPARTAKEFHVELVVTPADATIDITRFVPIYLNNTGNVPLSDFVVQREVQLLRTTASAPDAREWRTSSPVPAGTRVPLSAVATALDPATDLFWKASERANYQFRVSATSSGLSSSTDRIVSAFATYLFDDVEGGPRGESSRGDWAFEPGWGPTNPGFLTTAAYGFGDVQIGRYPAGSDASAVMPTVDISAARSAKLAFFHRYTFEPRFDAGVVEASADGGKTWTPLTPIPDALNKLPDGYDRTLPLSPASALHATGDPDVPVYGFTGDSCVLPAAVDCWVLSQFDLTGFPGVTEADVVYEQHGAATLGALKGGNGTTVDGIPFASEESWKIGAPEEHRYWSYQDLSDGAIRSRGGNASFWWSGSASRDDDGKVPKANVLLNIPVDLTAVQPDDKRIFVVDWWEWADRFGAAGSYYESISEPTDVSKPYPKDLRGAYTWHSGGVSAAPTWRFNVTQPTLVEREGHWMHLQSVIPADWYGSKLNVGFLYSPVKTAESASGTTAAEIARDYTQDRGFVIDDFQVRAYQVNNGQVSMEEVFLDEEAAWRSRFVQTCNGFGASFAQTGIPCFETTQELRPDNSRRTILVPTGEGTDGGRWQPRPANGTAPNPSVLGWTWALASEVPAVPGVDWQVVSAADESGKRTTATGEEVVAWYSGDTSCAWGDRSDYDGTCLRPGAESRLVTPAFDLARIAGSTATLTFDHRYGFLQTFSLGDYHHPLSSGGAVEIQRLDRETNTWGAWEQLYVGDPDAIDLCSVGNKLAPPPAARATLACNGGYSAYTVNATSSAGGRTLRGDANFSTVRIERYGIDAQFLYSGSSTVTCGDARKSWCDATFDLREYLGDVVRFGFHVDMSGAAQASNTVDGLGTTSKTCAQVQSHLVCDPDGNAPWSSGARHQGGWWIKDIAVRGDVLKGTPMQLRFRAATDGNVQDGFWQVDDIGVFGSRYAKNVGIFVQGAEHGIVGNGVATIPILLRNMGDTVRTGLAVEVRLMDPVSMFLNGTSPNGIERIGSDTVRFSGYNLAPGQSVLVELHVVAPKELPNVQTTFLATVKQLSTSGQLVAVGDNEVQGFLQREIPFRVTSQGIAKVERTVTTPAAPVAGEPVDLRVTLRNAGFGSLGFELTCVAQVVTGHEDLDHDKVALDRLEGTPPQACATVQAPPTLAPGEWGNATYRVTPATSGFLRFAVNGRVIDGLNNASLPTTFATAAVGVSPVVLVEGFGLKRDFVENWSRAIVPGTGTAPNDGWAHLKGHREAGSLLLGANESGWMPDNGDGSTKAYGCAPAVCAINSPPVDLHNYSREDVFLTLWHMDRLAYGDGWNVKAQVLIDEELPDREASWSAPCVLHPVDGYEDRVVTIPAAPDGTDPGDVNPIDPEGDDAAIYFVSENGVWETEWSRARFGLQGVECAATPVEGAKTYPLVGRTVRFLFQMGAGPADTADPGDFKRGPGQGVYIDDVSVGPMTLSVRPEEQRAILLDNTTKSFNVLLGNDGDMVDVVRLSLDEGNSSTPRGSLAVPSDPIVLQPGETRKVPIAVTLPRDPSLLPTEFAARILAVSDFDPNAFGATRLALAFGPRQWAELSLLVEPPTSPVQEGTADFIPITVENNGLVDSVASKVRVVDSYPGRADVVTDLDLPSMPSFFADADDASRVVEFQWRPAKGTLGLHTLTFIVDPQGLGEEYTRDNNVVVVQLPVVELLIPDLDVAGPDALRLRNAQGALLSSERDGDVSRYEVTAGELVTFELKVRNLGRAGATDVDIVPSIGSLNLPAKNLPYVAPGSEVVVTFNWLAQKPADGAAYDVRFHLQSEQVELDLANNDNPGRGVTLLTVKGYDLAFEVLEALGVHAPGAQLEVPFRLVNRGAAGEDVRLLAEAEGLLVTLSRDALFLRGGETFEGIATIAVPEDAAAGAQSITLAAVARENPAKTVDARATLDVVASHGGSVRRTDVEAAPPTFRLPIRLVNEGNGREPWLVNVKLPAGWTTKETLPMRVAIQPFSETEVGLMVTAPETTSPGEKPVVVTATLPDSTTRTATSFVTVRELRTASVELAEGATPRPVQGALAFPVTVENVGNTAKPFELVLTGLPDGMSARVSPSKFQLAPGARTVATLLVTPTDGFTEATAEIGGYALFEGVHPDGAEGRANAQSLTVRVTRPDLRAGEPQVAPRTGVEAGERVTVTVPVSNAGATAVPDLPVHLFVDDVFVAEVRIPLLAAGEKRDVSLNWTAVPGPHTLTVVVDPYKDLVEVDRADNAVAALASVEGELPGAGLAAGSAPVPGPSAGLSLLAIAGAVVALAALRRRRLAK